MLSRRDPVEDERSNAELNTIIGRGSVFEGTLQVQNSLRVDGRVQGNVQVGDSLIVGKEGEIDGEVRVRNAVIGGKVRDKVLANGKVVLEAKSVVLGEIRTSRLVIEEGAVFEGRCAMSENGPHATISNQGGNSQRPGIRPMEVHPNPQMAAAR